MLDSIKSDRLICEYLEKCYTEPATDLYVFVSNEYETLVERYGMKKIQAAIEACCVHYTSDEDKEWQEAASKLSKQEILEINTTIGFLCGIAVAELERKEKEG